MEGTSFVTKKLDKDLDNFFDEMVEKNKNYRYPNPLSEDNWEEEIENIPLFMTKTPDEIDPDKAPELAALQAIKYEEDDPNAKALSYKDDGNEEFKKGNYKKAIKIYSEAIKVNCGDPDIMSILFANRANAHFKIGNYRSSLNDATQAKTIQSGYTKAIFRGACCCFELELYDDVITWCKEGLVQDSSLKTFQDLSEKAILKKKQQERDKRKKNYEEKKKNLANDHMANAIMLRGIKLHVVHDKNKNDDEECQSSFGKLAGFNLLNQDVPGRARVYLDKDGLLHWPVLFMYPEYGQTDYIEDFIETSSFSDHIQLMFNGEKIYWDTENKYQPSRLQVYFEDIDKKSLIFIKQSSSLQQALSNPGYTVVEGTPAFILLVKDTPFESQFLAKYKFKK